MENVEKIELPIIKIGNKVVALNNEQKERLYDYIRKHGKSNDGYRKLIVSIANENETPEVITQTTNEMVNHPNHYGGEDNVYETIKVIEAWDLDFCLGNAVKYISRAGKKDKDKELEDLEKAAFYLERKRRNVKNAIAQK
jgi:hypothetical protein